jgi:hypothetical protein
MGEAGIVSGGVYDNLFTRADAGKPRDKSWGSEEVREIGFFLGRT